MAHRKIAFMADETLPALRTAMAQGTVAAFTEHEDAEAHAFLMGHPEAFDVVYIAGDGTITGTGRIVGNLAGPFTFGGRA